MYKTLTAIAVAAIVTVATVAAPHQAKADDRRVAAGIIGGLAAGAIIGSIAASNRYYYRLGYYGGLMPMSRDRSMCGHCLAATILATPTTAAAMANVGRPDRVRCILGLSCPSRRDRGKKQAAQTFCAPRPA